MKLRNIGKSLAVVGLLAGVGLSATPAGAVDEAAGAKNVSSFETRTVSTQKEGTCFPVGCSPVTARGGLS